MLDTKDILETIRMISDENLDVRTVTMGISLLDCADEDPHRACEKIYRKITDRARDLVRTAEEVSAAYGVPIVNKRISVTPIAMLLASCKDPDPVEFAMTLDAAAKKVGVNFVGGFSALVQKGFSAGDRLLIEAIPEALAKTDLVCSSVNVGSTKAGINMDAVALMGPIVKRAAEITAQRSCIGPAKLVVFCNAPEDNPFMAGAFHGPGEPDCEIHVGVSGPGAVRAALAKQAEGMDLGQVAELVKRTAFKITRMGQLVGNLVSERLGVPFGIVDLSLAPTPAAGDSVANVLEEMGLESCGCCGTTAALALLNDAVKKGGVMASINVGSTKAGINMDAVALMGPIVKRAAEITAQRSCIGPAKLVVFCNAPEDNPFMAGAFHGPGEPDCEIHVGVSGPGAVRAALAKQAEGMDLGQVAELVKRTAFKITRMGQLVGNLVSERLGVPFGIVDLSLAPTPAAGDSVANVLEEMGLESCGCCGTTAALALLNDAVKKGGVMASNFVGGLSGAFIPVSEDAGMIAAARCGSLSIEKLEAMTAVCSVGIDMVIIPGDTAPEVISALIADEAAIGMVNSKTTAVRVIPAIGKQVGDTLDFGGLLGWGPVMEINRFSPQKFVSRGGRIPAPLQSLKN